VVRFKDEEVAPAKCLSNGGSGSANIRRDSGGQPCQWLCQVHGYRIGRVMAGWHQSDFQAADRELRIPLMDNKLLTAPQE